MTVAAEYDREMRMARERVAWKYYPTYILAMGFCRLVRLFPSSWVWRIFGGASRLVYLADRRRRRIALSNLDIAFGDRMSAAEKRRIAKGAFRSLFLTAAEFILVPRLAARIEEVVKVDRTDPIDRALAEGRGVIFLISHLGNWELLAHRGITLGYRIASVARPLDNPLLDAEVERLRCLTGAVTLEKKWVSRDIFEKLHDGWCVAILFDQYAGRRGVFAPFFGRLISTTPAVALFAMKTGAAVVPIFNIRRKSGRFDCHVCDEIEIVNTGDRKADLFENCSRMNRVLEEWVRRYPDQWLWMHRRWKRSKPLPPHEKAAADNHPGGELGG